MHVRRREGTEQPRYNIERIIINSDYNQFSAFDSDYALIKLKTPATINDYVAPISFLQNKADYATSDCVITGWGTRSIGGKQSRVSEMMTS